MPRQTKSITKSRHLTSLATSVEERTRETYSVLEVTTIRRVHGTTQSLHEVGNF